MTAVEALFRVNPSLAWLMVACLLAAAELASAKMRFAWAALAALAPALLMTLNAPLGGGAQLALFAGLTTVALILFARERRAIRARAPRIQPAHGLPTPTAGRAPPSAIERFGLMPKPRAPAPKPPVRKPSPVPAGDPARAPALIGQTARTSAEFSNGLGRVQLAGCEWGAELVQGEVAPADTAVEVVGVSGGVRLRVRALAA